jgi:hypothetical protein
MGFIGWRISGIVTNRPDRWVRVMESGDPPTDRAVSIEVGSPPNPYMNQVVLTLGELHAIAVAAGLAPLPLTKPEGT